MFPSHVFGCHLLTDFITGKPLFTVPCKLTLITVISALLIVVVVVVVVRERTDLGTDTGLLPV